MPKGKSRPKGEAYMRLTQPRQGVVAGLMWGWAYEYGPHDDAFVLNATTKAAEVDIYLTYAQAMNLAKNIIELDRTRTEERTKRGMQG